jgi:hypothetical protein
MQVQKLHDFGAVDGAAASKSKHNVRLVLIHSLQAFD